MQKGVRKLKFNMLDVVLRKKNKLVEILYDIQRSMHAIINGAALRNLEIKLHKELDEILKQEEFMWFQWSRAK